VASDIGVGPFSFHLYGLMLAIGIIATLVVAFIEAKRRGEATGHLFNMAIIVIPLGVIGARLYHVIDQWDYYYQHPAEIFGFAGLGIYGAVIGGAIGVIIYTRWRKISTLRWMDIIVPGLILAQAIGRWGNYFNQELYGYPTNLPWGIYIDPAHRLPGFEAYTHFQPLFFYEFLWDLTGFIVLMIVARKLKTKLFDGDILLSYFVFYGIGRFALEGLKIDVWTIAGFPTARWISGIAVIVSLVLLIYRRAAGNILHRRIGNKC
jgi:phosphatidylglycerol:prolipoprotein diacylglycerol transferase